MYNREDLNVRDFRELECWKSCREINQRVSVLLKKLPQNEWELISNMKRAVRSTTRNIAEGYGRFHFKENIQFCRISRGSLEELKDDFITCYEEKYINEEEFYELMQVTQTSIRILNGYIKYLKSRLNE